MTHKIHNFNCRPRRQRDCIRESSQAKPKQTEKEGSRKTEKERYRE